jgi:hypothetical protein
MYLSSLFPICTTCDILSSGGLWMLVLFDFLAILGFVVVRLSGIGLLFAGLAGFVFICGFSGHIITGFFNDEAVNIRNWTDCRKLDRLILGNLG